MLKKITSILLVSFIFIFSFQINSINDFNISAEKVSAAAKPYLVDHGVPRDSDNGHSSEGSSNVTLKLEKSGKIEVSSNGQVIENKIIDCHGDNGKGIIVHNRKNVVVRNNLILNCERGIHA
jgi:hypothetical protein